MHDPCELCGRSVRKGTTRHHLIPRTCHRNKWFKKNFTRHQMQSTIGVCTDCHRAIHQLIPSEKELGRYYHSLEHLRAHPGISRFRDWIQKQK